MHRDGIILITFLLCLAYVLACVRHRGLLWVMPGTWNEAYGRVFTYKRVYHNWHSTCLVTVHLRGYRRR